MALSDLSGEPRAAAQSFLLAIGDDEFLHGERLKQWLSVAPTLEEDNVLTSLAQDEMGHARLWYELLDAWDDRSIDELAIFRPAAERRNSVLVERPHADFADTVIRLFCYDTAERLLLDALAESEHAAVAERATVIDDEEAFHREHADRWLDVLAHVDPGDGQDRLAAAVAESTDHAGDLFAFASPEALAESGVLGAGLDELEAQWRTTVLPALAELPVDIDENELVERFDAGAYEGRAGEHTPAFGGFIESLQPGEMEKLEI